MNRVMSHAIFCAVTNPSYSQPAQRLHLSAAGFNFSVAQTVVTPGVLYVSGFIIQVQYRLSSYVVNMLIGPCFRMYNHVDFANNFNRSSNKALRRKEL